MNMSKEDAFVAHSRDNGFEGLPLPVEGTPLSRVLSSTIL